MTMIKKEQRVYYYSMFQNLFVGASILNKIVSKTCAYNISCYSEYQNMKNTNTKGRTIMITSDKKTITTIIDELNTNIESRIIASDIAFENRDVNTENYLNDIITILDFYMIIAESLVKVGISDPEAAFHTMINDYDNGHDAFDIIKSII